MFSKLLIGNEKSIIGGISAGVLSLGGQVGVNGQLTLKEGAYSIVTWVITHLVIWITTNSSTPTPPAPPVSPSLPTPPALTTPVTIVPSA